MDSQTVPSRYRWVKVPGGEGWLGVGASAKEVRLVHLDGDENYVYSDVRLEYRCRKLTQYYRKLHARQ